MPSPRIHFRVSPEVQARVHELAALHGRDPSEEMRMAWRLFDLQSSLAWLMTDEAKAAFGDEHAASVEDVKSDLRALTARAFPHPRGPLLDPDKSKADPRMN
jgi:hypothetical protein